MSTSLIKTFDFQGTPLAFRQSGGDWVVTADEVARALGYSDPRQVTKLHKRNEPEFKPGESSVVSLTTEGGQRRRVRTFSPRGAMRVAILAETAAASAFRDFVLDVIEKLRTGEARLVTEDRLEQILASKDDQIAVLMGMVKHLQERAVAAAEREIESAGLMREIVGNSGRLLRYVRFNPPTEAEKLKRALAVEKRERVKGQRFLTPPPAVNGNRLTEN